ncbi:hypothetical protein EST38_g1891 [Candolleomyces aberdarensis]|uniref:PH domain-containing protein n=1 Tax=Candolleomyces aberdarensis TaxID=2316362 RepID=A0A4Q2DTX2_9AGAR|nr:hypothetical protein EST38_g1891 [Candolleomyces aberdarensis]
MAPVHALDKYYLTVTLLVTVGYQLLGFAIAWTFQFDKITDFTGGSNFFLLAILTLCIGNTFYARNVVASVLVMFWACRIAGFLLFRVLKMGSDTRFDEIRSHFWKFLGFWIGQIVWVWTVSLPVTILNSPAVSDPSYGGSNPAFGTSRDIAGIVVWAIGFLIESFADAQKYRAKASGTIPKGHPMNSDMSSEAEKILSAYNGVVQGELSWILLHYAYEQSDELELYCYGAEGLEEMKNKFYDLDQIFVAFYREELEETPGYALINYIPASTTHVQRVNSRRVGVILKKHQTMLTIDNLSQLTLPMIHKALVQPEPFSPPAMGASISLSSEPARSKFGKKPKPINIDHIPRRSFSETYAPQFPVPHQFVPPVPLLPSNHKSSGMLGGFLRRKKRDNSFDNDLPPPIPPKDDSIFLYKPPVPRESPPRYLASLPNAKRPSPTGSFSEWGVVSRLNGREVVVLPMDEEPPLPPTPPPPQIPKRVEVKSLPLKGKWARNPSIPSDPKERQRARQEARKQRELEERQAQEDERKRQEEIRRRKAEEKRRDEEEEIERRLRLEEELRQIAAERERKRRWEEEEEERKRRELEDKKRWEREKRLEEHKKLEQWRKQREKSQAEEARRSEEMRRREEDERRRKIQQAEKLVVQTKSVEPSITSGWVTIQFPDSLFWKRRYYRFVGRELHLHRSEKDLNTTLETLGLSGTVKALKEWKDGYEELEAIPYSFVVEFKDEKGTLSLFADSEEEKFRFLGLFKLRTWPLFPVVFKISSGFSSANPMEASPPPRRALKRSASTASLLTPPRTHRRRARGRSRGSCDSDSDSDDHRSKHHSDEEDEGNEPEGKRRVIKKRKLSSKAPQDEEDEEAKFWGGELPQVGDTKASSSRSKKPLLYQRFQSQSTGGTVSSEQGLVSPPPSHRKPAVPPAPVPGSPSPATTVSLPTTPQPKSKHKKGGSDSLVGLLRDSPTNPFIATPTGADSSDQVLESPSALLRGDQSPTPVYDKPTVTYVFRGVKRVYQNPMYNHAKSRPLSPPPNSKLPVEHPEFSPDPSCRPTLLFPEAHKKRKTKKAAAASSAKRSNRGKGNDSEDEDESLEQTLTRGRVKQPKFAKALTLDAELKKVAKKAVTKPKKAQVEDDPFC